MRCIHPSLIAMSWVLLYVHICLVQSALHKCLCIVPTADHGGEIHSDDTHFYFYLENSCLACLSEAHNGVDVEQISKAEG